MTTTTGTVRAVIYTRQSKDAKGDRLAVARQLDHCERLAAARGWKVAHRISDNDTSASNGKPRKGFSRVMELIQHRSIDVVIVWAVDRLVRRLADLEAVIDACERAGVKLATVSGDLDLSTDQGRLVGRILASVARGEVERKSARQKAAAFQAAQQGRRRTGCPRPFGYADDHVTPEPAEAAAIESACRMLLGGGTISGVARDWTRLGVRPPQAADGWKRSSVREILLNPRIAGLSVYRGEIVGKGEWAPLVSEETWRAVVAILEDPARKPPRGVRTLLGGLATCPCGNVVTGSVSQLGQHVYRCTPQTRNSRPGPHVARQAAPVDAWVSFAVIERLSRPDAADLIATPTARADVAALREEAAAIRRRLNDLAADAVDGTITRAQLHAASARATTRLDAIDAELADTGREDVLAPLIADENVAAVWEELDLSRKRAVLSALWDVVLHPTGRGSRGFDPNTIELRPADKSE
jgi:site-specific DNA recombinase